MGHLNTRTILDFYQLTKFIFKETSFFRSEHGSFARSLSLLDNSTLEVGFVWSGAKLAYRHTALHVSILKREGIFIINRKK
jgi:hypothetical protein